MDLVEELLRRQGESAKQLRAFHDAVERGDQEVIKRLLSEQEREALKVAAGLAQQLQGLL